MTAGSYKSLRQRPYTAAQLLSEASHVERSAPDYRCVSVLARANMERLFSESRKKLVRHLSRRQAGATVGELATALGVSRTAIRQHLVSLQREGLVVPSGERSSPGRPNRLYLLTDAGKEAFTRRYSWFAHVLVETILEEHGAAGLRTRLGRIAGAVVAELDHGQPRPAHVRERIAHIALLMDQLGYDAHTFITGTEGRDVQLPDIEADNCVFHELAMKQPEICHFDVALLSGYTGAHVTLHECMARGGQVCRFRFQRRS